MASAVQRHLHGALQLSFRASLLIAFYTTVVSTAVAQIQGPSSSATPYIVPVAAGVQTISILTVGDSVNNKPNGDPYRMVGIPDGLGAYNNADGTTFTALMNHELNFGEGVVRAHGSNGSFVSEWTINRATLEVTRGQDLIQQVVTWNPALNGGAGGYNAAATGVAIGRLCSGDLAPISSFYNPVSGLGTQERIFLSGEEAGSDGRLFGHIATGASKGISFELPHHGKFSWENALANPFSGDKTVVIGTNDQSPGQVYVYVGDKTNTGSDVDKAGLTNGKVFGVAVPGAATESRINGINGATAFTLADIEANLTGGITVPNATGAQFQTASTIAGVTEFLRPEDGAWDPSNPNHFYFVTTDRYDEVKDGVGFQIGRSRLWRLRLNSLLEPVGGQIDMLLDGTEAGQTFDNICVDTVGNVLIQEDPGGTAHLGKIWNYNIASDTLSLIAQHDPARFGNIGVPATAPFTRDEESSGIMDASEIVGYGWFLLDVQAQYPLGGELVAGGNTSPCSIRPPCPRPLLPRNPAPLLSCLWEASWASELCVAAIAPCNKDKGGGPCLGHLHPVF